ncbi:MAG: glycosyltransferase family 9 protein [bacterium]|nr:glycosyltransferase family 9 protein [bacterium]
MSMRILITRLSHIGDCIATLPMANAIRDAFPFAEIGWIVETPTNQLFENHPSIDHLIAVKRGWLTSPSRLADVRRQVRSLKFDIAIDPQSLTKSSVPGWLSGAKRRIGLAAPKGKELAPWLNNELVKPTKPHIIHRSLELLKPLGIVKPNIDFRLWSDPQAEAKIDDFLTEQGLDRSFAVINPGAGWLSRRWPHKRFGGVARELGQNPGIRSVVAWAGEEEQQWAEEIVAESGGHAVMAPKTSLRELAALLKRSRFYLGGDTGPMHLAVAVGASCIVLYGPTSAETAGAFGPQHVSIQADFQQGHRRTAGNEAMQTITIDRVVAGCREWLSNQPAEDSPSGVPRAA